MIKISATGDVRTLNVFHKAGQGSRQAIRNALSKVGTQLAGARGIIKLDMKKAKSGKIYKYGQASRVGESPAYITGKLSNSVYHKMEGDTLVIGADTPYARILEKGGNSGKGNKTYIAARRYLIRPVINARRDIITNIQNELNKLIK